MRSTEIKPADDLHMSGAEFDKLMRKALQVPPAQAPQPKPCVKLTKGRKPAKKTQPK